MRVPIRKPGKDTHLKPDPHITKAKFAELEAKLHRLLEITRPRAIEEVQRMAQMGDFSENTGYQYAKGRLRGINQRILDIENMLKNAEIIAPNVNYDTVQLGHSVTIENQGKRKTYQILGSTQTNPSKGIISHNSPLGCTLMGKKVGESATLKIGDKISEFKIIEIAPSLKK